jgi:hypothetical protein
MKVARPLASLDVRVRDAIAAWDEGRASRSETLNRLLDLVTIDTVNELMATLTDEWRQELLETFREYRDMAPDAETLTIHGGSFLWEHEADPAKREQMIREYQDELAKGRARFRDVTLPAMQKWLAENDPPDKRSTR